MKKPFTLAAQKDYFVDFDIVLDMLDGRRLRDDGFVEKMFSKYTLRLVDTQTTPQGYVRSDYYDEIMFFSFFWGMVLTRDPKGIKALNPNTYPLIKIVHIAHDCLIKDGLVGVSKPKDPMGMQMAAMLSHVSLKPFKNPQEVLINQCARAWLDALPETWVMLGREINEMMSSWNQDDINHLLWHDASFFKDNQSKSMSAHEKMHGEAMAREIRAFFTQRMKALAIPVHHAGTDIDKIKISIQCI